MQLVPVKEIAFEVPFMPWPFMSGYCDKGNDANSFYYFTNYRTAKQIVFCNEDGHLTDSISLMPFYEDVPNIWKLLVKSKDSMLFVCMETNIIYRFGKNAPIKMAPAPDIKWGSYLYLSYGGPNHLQQNVDMTYTPILFSRYEFLDTVTGRRDWDKINELLRTGPVLAKMDHIFTDSPVFTPQLAGVKSRFLPKGHGTTGPDLYLNTDRSIYYVNPNSDTLYQYNTDGALVKLVPIETANGPFGNKSVPFAENTQGLSDTLREEKSFIRYGNYDPYRHLLYLMYFHKVAATTPPGQKDEHRAWSMLVYNEQMEKLAEIPFERDTYSPHDLIVTPKGILLKKINLHINELHPKQTYQLFKVEQ